MSNILDEILTFQSGDEEIKLRVFGDEFYARRESLDGYTAIYDPRLDKYCYAKLENGELVSTGKSITGEIPEGVTPHLKESTEVRKEKFEKNYSNSGYSNIEDIDLKKNTNDNVERTKTESDGLLAGRKRNNGKIKGLTVIVEFADISTNITPYDVEQMLNGENYNRNGNYCSVNKYFKTVSDGKLDYSNDVIGPIKLSHRRNYYINESFIDEVMNIVVNNLNIDLSIYDSLKEGIVDAVNFLYAGETVYEGALWPHNSYKSIEFNDIKTGFYMLSSVGKDVDNMSIGTFCHESGHLLCRFADLYDYGKRDGDNIKSKGLSIYCLMGSGNHLNNGRTPSPICAYLRDLADWCDNKANLNEAGSYIAKHGEYNTVMKYKTSKPDEYFIIENRATFDLDKYLPSSGLAIYHCDKNGSNEWQQGTPEQHYQCALLQADGKRDLERDVNYGDKGDLFGERSGITVSNNTNPSSKEWDGSDSGFVISNITKPDINIQFKIG
ncbi:secreted metalloprotease [Clostridium phage HM T]|uniref:Secreted metalloprotease n=1 Tax=Clostridium saccharoperbutylacetonicum N1-4(HMT) TaxID=931276 RepID=M1MTA1_9CLOT|nr:M6 family metalloprotease domain-containing protein [Clostridium saccharoperbutylacetonicum]AMB17435.1 secreted metalloprotease [Clostridium phage HM T]AGF54787.1 secreted metalloprotease [Clostridium saccharoperbutylacetonicum N1-4(HMT)]NRT58692.1 M6 family metalloprotease-like protein [Clostridium saccharoperbutylacetonicum]NSB27881.1 M6 family metalloprotease-like protein [Clostridium saccharoperbutylacetonicum]NSB41364.1 M6 family metalloprotease-like protein [Clostridium saccharoperbut